MSDTSGCGSARPNPSEIGEALGDYVEAGDIEEEFTIQGYWSQAGVEKAAYYLGADTVDQTVDGNDTTLIDDVYPDSYGCGFPHLNTVSP